MFKKNYFKPDVSHKKKLYICTPKLKSNLKQFKMYAIVEIAGQQFKIEKDQKIYVHRLNAEEGSKIDFERVLLVDNDGNIKVGNPTVSGAKVSATVLNHLKGDKVLVFKKKRRKGYQKLNGHRQYLSRIEINGIEA